MNNQTQNKKFTLTGIVITIAVTAGFVFAVSQWVNRYNWPVKLSEQQIPNNEAKAFENLQLIAAAQEKFKKIDAGKESPNSYAIFFTHLWTSVDADRTPVKLNLIPEKLAIATYKSRAVSGYCFENIHTKETAAGKSVLLDYEIEWAVAAYPAEEGKTGTIVLIVDASGDIFAKKGNAIPEDYPYDKAAQGWIKLNGAGSPSLLE
jgi:hypothetical protein